MSRLAEEAYILLGGKTKYEFMLEYSGRFADYNAQVKRRNNDIFFSSQQKMERDK